jgi:peptide/nickel transport system substrate-binding protein
MNEFEFKLKAAEKLAAKSSVSRRDFLQLAALAGLTIPAANALLLDSARAQEPKKGGNFIIGMEGGSASDSLDPRTYADSVMIGAATAWSSLMTKACQPANCLRAGKSSPAQ